MTPMTLTAYAARRGVSVKAVSKAVAAGRLERSVTRDEHGAPKIADPDLADREWDANTRRRVDRASDEQPADAPPPAQSEAPAAAPPRHRETSLPEGVPAYHVSQAVRAQAAARREAAVADLAELELERERGRLVDAVAANAGYEEHVARAKDRLLGVPTQLGQRMPDIAARVVPIANELIREALKELALDGEA